MVEEFWQARERRGRGVTETEEGRAPRYPSCTKDLKKSVGLGQSLLPHKLPKVGR